MAEIRKTRKKTITGKIDEENFASALAVTQTDSLIDSERVLSILKECMLKAYLSWTYPGLFVKAEKDDPARNLVKAEIIFNNKKFKIYDYKTVTNEDDIIDDSYQISLEDAQEIKASAKLGDTIKIPFDVKQLDKSFVRKVKQLFQARIREASKSSILSLYQSQIKGLIQGTVTRIEADGYEINFGKAIGILKNNKCIPEEHFAVNDRVTVYLSSLSEKTTPPTLVISRSGADFIIALLKDRIPEIHEGVVKIKAISRQAGKRTKVFVQSTNPNVDPVGACIGPESGRMASILNELKGEKVDILRYYENKALQIIEAMKPAEVIGMTNNEDFFDENVHFDEIEKEPNYEYPVVTVIVNNGSQGIAIGTGGANVKLASKITKTSINIKESDDAIKENTNYIMLPEILKLTQPNIVEETPTPKVEEKEEQLEEIEEELEQIVEEEIKPIETKKKEIVDLDRMDNPKPEKKKKEKQKENVQDKPEEKEKVVEEQTSTEPVEPEHIEIKNKPKIRLEDLESALDTKKTTVKKQVRSSKKKEEEEVVIESESTKVDAMPIYTDEELASFEDEQQYEEEDTSYIDEEYEDYQ